MSKPKICVSICEKSMDAILEKVKKINNTNADFIEWRMDYYEKVKDLNKIEEVLNLIHKISFLPIIATFRTIDEGGNKEITKEFYCKLNKFIQESKKVQYVDIQVSTGIDEVKTLINNGHKNSCGVILSMHDFNKTPSLDKIISTLEYMIAMKSDIVKIALMPENLSDVLNLLYASNYIKEKHKDVSLICISMGKIGALSRITGEIFGSCMTFASLNAPSAPGQISIENIDSYLNVINELCSE